MWTQISERVVELIKENLMLRNQKGFDTYKETMDDVPFENYDWNVMIIEELLDAMQYSVKENEKLKQMNKDLVKTNKILLNSRYGKNVFEEVGKMDFSLYQEMSKRTMPNGGVEIDGKTQYSANNVTNYAMGLGGEAGELIDLLKKVLHHGHDFERHKFVGEVGDVLHYLSGLCTMYDISLEECATMNLHKLGKRYANGFSKEASIARVDVKA